jgi:hypothetical protein
MVDKALRYTLLFVCYVEAWCAPNGAYQAIRFACNSAGTEELPFDDTHVSKHVGAAE